MGEVSEIPQLPGKIHIIRNGKILFLAFRIIEEIRFTL